MGEKTIPDLNVDHSFGVGNAVPPKIPVPGESSCGGNAAVYCGQLHLACSPQSSYETSMLLTESTSNGFHCGDGDGGVV